jgi:hypothetical protein
MAYARVARRGWRAVARHRDCLGTTGCACQGQAAARQDGQPGRQQAPPQAGTPGGLQAVIGDRHRAVHELRAAGRTQAQAAAALGLSLQLTGRFWRAASPAEPLKVPGSPALDPYKPYLQQRWDQGITKIAVLHREITALGYAGSYGTAYAWLALLKLAAPPAAPAPPTKQQVSRWMLTNPARLDSDEQAQLAAILGRCPELNDLAGHVTEFAKILTGRLAGRLDDWLAAVEASPGQPELASFAHGIRRDYQAVRNALTMEWNSGRDTGYDALQK